MLSHWKTLNGSTAMAVYYRILLSLYTCLILVGSVYASDSIKEIRRDQALEKIVSSIAIVGLQRTRPDVVRRELLIVKGRPLRLYELEESLQRFKNLHLFHTVVANYYLDELNQVHIRLTFAESYTTIPILKINSGGDTRYLVAGVYDINSLGQYLETGVQYESWNGEDGGVVWFRNPRLMNERFRFGADVWSVKHPRNVYEPDGTRQGDFVTYQRKLNVFVDKEWFNGFTLGMGVELNQTQLLDGTMSDLLSLGVSQAIENHSEIVSHWTRVYFTLGRLDYDNVLLQGRISEFNINYASPNLGSDYEAYVTNWDNKIFWRVGEHANVGWRLKWAKTNSQQLQDLFYIGGFENVRGYYDGQLRGKQFWQSNLEYRKILFATSWYYLQGNIFADGAQLVNPTMAIETNSNDIFYGTGIGLRLGSPKIYRFLARLDIALLTSHPATSRVSFAVQQFF